MAQPASSLAVASIKPKKRNPDPKGPGYGTLGTVIKIFANHYQVTTQETGYFYRYDVDMVLLKSAKQKGSSDGKKGGPGGDGGVKKELPKALKRKILNLFVAKNQAAGRLLAGIIPAYDGQKILYTMKELKIVKEDGFEDTVDIPADPDGGARQVVVTIKPTKPCAVSWKALYDAIARRTQDNPIEVIQCINTVFREAAMATATNIAVNRSFFTREMNEPSYIGAGREIWSGFYSSARAGQWKVTLNLDKANTVFYKKMPVMNFLWDFNGSKPLGNDHERRNFEKEIKGLKVETTYHGIRRQRVTGVSRESVAQAQFDIDGKKTTVQAYFKAQYKVNLKYPELPCLKIGTKGNLIPIEVATLLEQKVEKLLTPDQTQKMVKMCTQTAPERKRQVESIRNRIVNYDESPHLKEFKIGVNKNMMALDARILPMPAIKAIKAKPVQVKTLDGTWDPRDDHFSNASTLKNWVVIGLADRNLVERFVTDLVAMGKKKGMTIEYPDDSCVPPFGRDPDFAKIIAESSAAMTKKGRKLDMILFVTDRADRYPAIKQAGDVTLGVVTQVILAQTIKKNLDRGMPQLVSNMLLKINGKLGGTNSQLDNFVPPKTPPQRDLMTQYLKKFTQSPTIVFGADVTHPSPGESQDKPSIAAVVASHNRTFTSYAARVMAQGHRVEIMANLTGMVKELLIEFRKQNNNVKPTKIVFYRDGVSEGQFEQVLIAELNAVQAACRQLEDGYTPNITYIIVGKRHHTRMFCANDAQQIGRGLNVPPGTITDKDICHYSEMDWFLCSHGGIQGTSRPAHYNVLYDDSDFSADEIELFSYYLTFCYARCNRSVSIPAPAYYAHHVAFRARHHLTSLNDDSSSQPSTMGHGRAQVDMADINRRIKVHQNVMGADGKGMYFV